MRNNVIKPLDAETGRLEILADDQTLSARNNPSPALDGNLWGAGVSYSPACARWSPAQKTEQRRFG